MMQRTCTGYTVVTINRVQLKLIQNRGEILSSSIGAGPGGWSAEIYSIPYICMCDVADKRIFFLYACLYLWPM